MVLGGIEGGNPSQPGLGVKSFVSHLIIHTVMSILQQSSQYVVHDVSPTQTEFISFLRPKILFIFLLILCIILSISFSKDIEPENSCQLSQVVNSEA